MNFPKVIRVRQNFVTASIDDISGAVSAEVQKIKLADRVQKGQRIAITAGSRGVANIAPIIKTLVEELKALETKPFIIPAMGSHGGATPEGQIEMLESLGITEESIGAPIISSLEVVQIATTEEGIPVWIDKNAAEADGIIVVNRVKPHTEFEAEIESGLMKMMVIGLGKHKGATTAHQHIIKRGYRQVVPSVAKAVMQNAKILFGMATVENVYHNTAIIKAVLPEELEDQEKRLLVEAKKLMGRIPFDELDVLVVSQMGKQVSGTGMDTNVIGRIYSQTEPDPSSPIITRIAVLDLAEETHGNAIGIGLADFTTKRLVDKINYNTTYINGLTGLVLPKAKIPITCENDFDAISKALLTCGPSEPEVADLVWIKDTLALEEFYISTSLLPRLKDMTTLQVISEVQELPFDEHGNLPKWSSKQ